MKISQKSSVFNWQAIQKCQNFIETPGSVVELTSTHNIIRFIVLFRQDGGHHSHN